MPSFRSFLKINTIGNWGGVMKAFTEMGFDINQAAKNGQISAAKKILKLVKNHIQKQDLPWEQLQRSTIRRKNSSDIYLDTHIYFESINYWWENKIIKIGVKRGISYPSNGPEVAQVGIWMELGTKYMPARPVWGPSIEELGKEGIKNIVADTIVRKLERTFKGTPAQITRGWVLSHL